MSEETISEDSSGNVFEDLGLPDADLLMKKTQLAIEVLNKIDERGFTQIQAAKFLETGQACISRIKNGRQLEKVSFELLVKWLRMFDVKVSIELSYSALDSKQSLTLAPA